MFWLFWFLNYVLVKFKLFGKIKIFNSEKKRKEKHEKTLDFCSPTQNFEKKVVRFVRELDGWVVV